MFYSGVKRKLFFQYFPLKKPLLVYIKPENNRKRKENLTLDNSIIKKQKLFNACDHECKMICDIYECNGRKGPPQDHMPYII